MKNIRNLLAPLMNRAAASFSSLTGSPTDNSALSTALAGKATVLKAYQAANLAKTNDTLADTDLSVSAEAAGKYAIKVAAHLVVEAGDFKAAFGGAATATNFIAQWVVHSQNDVLTTNALKTTSIASTLTGSGFFDGKEVFLEVNGTIEVNAGGTFILQFAQDTTNATPTTFLRGSYMTLTKLN